MGYSAKSAKQILEQKVQEDRLRAEAEKKKLIQDKERSAILKRNQQQLDRKINRLAGMVLEVALNDREYQFTLDKKVTADLSLRGELQRRGFEFEREERTEDPPENEYLPLARKMLKSLRKIESLSLDTANQIEQIVRKYKNDYIVLSLAQWREITTVIDGKFSKKFDESNLRFHDYQALCKKFDEIQKISIFDVEYDLDLDCSEYSKEISPSEVIKEIVYDLGNYQIDDHVKLGNLLLRWENPEESGPQYEDDFFTAEKIHWITSKYSSKFTKETFDRIQELAADKKTSMRLYLSDIEESDCKVSYNGKIFTSFPFTLNTLLDLFKKLGYQVKDKTLKDNNGDSKGSVTISWA